MVEADYKHYISCFCGTDEHVTEKSYVVADIEESESVFERILLNEETYCVRRLRLEIAMVDVKHFVKESADMESKTVFLLIGKNFSILVVKDPSALRECELQFVTIICSIIRRNDRGDFRYIKMADAHQLVVDLLLLRLQLHFVWKRLPFASSAYAEMFAERLQTVL